MSLIVLIKFKWEKEIVWDLGKIMDLINAMLYEVY